MTLDHLANGAEGGSRTRTRLPSAVFETAASAIPPLRRRGRYYSRTSIRSQTNRNAYCVLRVAASGTYHAQHVTHDQISTSLHSISASHTSPGARSNSQSGSRHDD